MIRYNNILLLIILCIASCNSLKQALKNMEAGEYSVAIHRLKKSLKPEDAEKNYQLGEAYRQSNRISEAEPYYLAAIKAGLANEKAYYYYALALKANNNIEKERELLDQYLSKAQDEEVIALAQRELESLGALERIEESYYRVKNLEDLNTEYAEYAPVYSNGLLYFTSNRHGGKVYKGTGTPFTGIFSIETRGAKVKMETLQAISTAINEPNVNMGSITMSKNQKVVTFAKANTGKASGTKEVNLYYTQFSKGKWQKPRLLRINGKDSWDSTPALSPDGSTLYFSSNRKGGLGGLDLYTATRNRRGRWVNVKNMGNKINTPGNEIFPYIGETGIFYFSSDGWPGFGNLDLFAVTRERGQNTVKNLGLPINSPADDFGLFLFNPSRGFFTSNRKGGKGDDDIYTFVNNDPELKIVNYWLVGKTLTHNDKDSLVTLSNTKVTLVGGKEETIAHQFTQADGKYKIRVFPEEDYYLVGEKEDYFTTRTNFTTLGKSVDKSLLKDMVTHVEFELDVVLDEIILDKPIVLNNIYYDLNKADIKKEAAKELDKLVVLMQDNPNITIELSSHTDARADPAYNMDLSRRRAFSAAKYIISRGIAAKRIKGKGYGETRLLIGNAKTEEEHQVNRRTEFKVTKYNKKVAEKLTEEKQEESKNADSEAKDETDRFFQE